MGDGTVWQDATESAADQSEVVVSGPKSYPMLRMAEWLRKNEVRLFFGVNGAVTVVEMRLPWIRSAKNVRVVDYGMGLSLGDGRDVSALELWKMPGRVIRARRAAPRRRAA